MNMLPVHIVESNDSVTTVALPSRQRIVLPFAAGTLRPGDAATLGIRPEALHIDPGGPIAARVSLVERLGGLTLLHIKAEGDEEMTVQIEGSDPTKAHDQIQLSIDIAGCHLFDKAGLALKRLDRHPLAA
jgi:multiple sugar transport system ATP-binding protein